MDNTKVYLINLSKDEKRLEFMHNQLSELGVSYERVEAVNGKEYILKKGEKYSEDLLKNKYGNKYKEVMTDGAVGAALSHNMCYEKFLELSDNMYKYALIFEDDVEIIDRNFKDIIKKLIIENERLHRWDYLQFDYYKPGFFMFKIWISQGVEIFLTKDTMIKKVIFGFKFLSRIPAYTAFSLLEGLRNHIYRGPVKFYRNVASAGCYLVNKDAARELFNKNHPFVKTPADWITNKCKNENKFKFMYYCPVITRQKRQEFGSYTISQNQNNIEKNNLD